MLFNAKVTLLNVFVILLAIEFQSKNGVSSQDAEGENTPNPSQQSSYDTTTDNKPESNTPLVTVPSTTSSNLSQAEIISNPENNTKSTVKPNDNSIFSYIDNSEESVTIPHKGKIEEDELQAFAVGRQATKQHKLVAEIIASSSIFSNNSLILINFLNLSSEKHDVLQLGERFSIGSIENLEFNHETFSYNWKTADFSNIKAYNNVLIEPAQYYNNFTCASQKIEIVLNIVPENMTFKGDYSVRENTSDIVKSNGSFTFNQTGARLSYKFASLAELHNQQNWKQHANIIYENGQVKFTELCDNQCDLLITSAEMFEKIKSRILEELNHTWIVERTNQFTSVFPFLSLCSSAPAPETNKRKTNYYVINDVVSKNYKSSNFKMGPIILKGLDNFTDGNVTAIKRRLPQASNGFLVSALSNHIQGQCDWHYFNNNSNTRPSNKYSFTFSIEKVRFSAGVKFLDSWNVDNLEISLSQINIHRLDKGCPKIMEFTKFMLQDFVHEVVVDSLKDLFIRRFPELKITTTTSTSAVPITNFVQTATKSKPTESREVVYWTTRRPRDWADVSTNNNDHLPFPTRRVFTACKDTRKWWQKLFYKNKCAQYRNSEDV